MLPRVQLAPSRFQCARRIECHFVFNSSVYLFFARFTPYVGSSRHSVVLIACSETRALFSMCCCLVHFFVMQVSSAVESAWDAAWDAASV